MKTRISSIFTSALFFISFLISQSAFAQNPEGCAGSDCSCGGTLFGTGCKSGWCCKPNVAECLCTTFYSKCSCGPGSASGPSMTIPVITELNEKNYQDFSAFFLSKQFSSAEAQSIGNDLKAIVVAARNNDVALFYAIGARLDATAEKLPLLEKQRANSWLSGHGQTVLIH